MTSEQQADPAKKTGGGLLRSSLVVGIMTMLSRVLGLVRDVVVAFYFGSQAEADAFFVAFKIPNFLRRLFAEGAFSQAFVPVLSEYRTKRSHEAVQELVNRVAGTLGFTLTIVTVFAMVGAPWLIMLFAPGFHGDAAKMTLAGEMLRITFPYLLLISLTAFAGSILNSYNKFAVPAFTPVVLNISLIGATVLLTPYFEQPVMALAWGVVIAGVSQLLLQIPFLKQIQLLPVPMWGWKDEGVRKILRLMGPAMFGVSVAQINLLLDTVLASFLQTGSISWLYYSDRLMELPLGVFGIAIATVILPSLSRQHASEDPKAFSKTLDWALRMVLLIGVPAAVALYLLAEPLIATLFFHGRMEGNDVLMAAMSLRAYAIGLLFFMLIKVLAPGFFARQDTKTPVKIAIVAMVANMAFNLMLVWNLQHAGLALATSLSAALNAGLLFRGLKKSGVFQVQPGWMVYGGRLLAANAALVGCIFWLVDAPAVWLNWGMLDRVWHLAVLVVAGISAYVITLLACGIRPRHFVSPVKH
ncbi:murein biosynthesis integral membrane protein MurJ [Parendozoicomonas haliclonae]|uniref:Probable lipid II flippase MurJ n=1 Tax=Parendozoicomonas haliclonae TaxID=1960125 RepID=A0A1X7AQF4_9GAMM|nr:murein biosynthesis integral membrane protein MurJ [Parendozoicomonas haliclonae]SMA50362.1 putative peptidoglycan biosynthesis protein MurJ [Parendozoicomonas haliclonae]